MGRGGAVWLAVLAACGLRDVLPEGPVLGPYARTQQFPGPVPSGVRYLDDGADGPPVLPLQLFGVHYDLDLAWRSLDPDWDMHELALLRRPEGPLWIVKEARMADKAQIVTADLPDLAAWLPEVPVERHRAAVAVADASTGAALDLRATWQDPLGREVAMRWRGRPPETLLRDRNGNTMGHSRDAVLVALDLSHRDFGRVDHRVDGRRIGLQRILGMIPFATALSQTQGGFSVGAWRQDAAPGGFLTVHAPLRVDGRPGAPVAQAWRVDEADGRVVVETHSSFRTLRYEFVRAGAALELHRASVVQWDRPTPVASVVFAPCLPDLRRRFAGAAESAWVLDVNGQASHARGTARVTPTGEGAVVDVDGTAPRWVADRPLQATIRRTVAGAEVVVVRR